MKNNSLNKGFTLVELLVSISIIMLLSSIVLASVNAARLDAKDAAIRAAVGQFRGLLEQSYDDSRTYANLVAQWTNTESACNSSFGSGGSYRDQARALCATIVNNVATSNGSKLYTYGTTQMFTIMAWLPGKKAFYCLGSSGRWSDTDQGSWGAAGCLNNP